VPAISEAREYVIGVQDVLSVSVLESPDLSREVKVALDGTVGLPLLAERVKLQGLTLTAAESLLETKYREAGILLKPDISISVKELLSKPVTVSGSVRNPGVLQLGTQAPLLRVVTQAGGITEEAGSVVQIFRGGSVTNGSAGEKPEMLTIQLERLQQGDVEANIPVYGGDTVNIPPAGAVYVVGAVKKPGRYLVRGGGDDSLTVLRVIALAEDLTRTAKPKQAVLIRKDSSKCAKDAAGTDCLQQLAVDVTKILRKEAPDVTIQPNDVLYIPDSTGKRALARGLEAALQIAVGASVIGIAR
jgi:polysaccharide export outer membrane protein